MNKITFVVAGLALAAAPILSRAEAADSTSSLMNIKVPPGAHRQGQRPQAAGQREPEDQNRQG
jgi:hypothetical protein